MRANVNGFRPRAVLPVNSERGLVRAHGLSFIFAVIVGLVQFAQAQNSVPRAEIDRFGSKVERRTLSNGLRVVFYRRGMAAVFSSTIAVKVGGVDEHVGATGISHMLEHMAFKGTHTIGTGDYARESELLSQVEDLAPRSAHFTPQESAEWQRLHEELKKIWKSEEFSSAYEEHGAVGINATTDQELTSYYISLPRSEFEYWAQTESDRILNPVMRQFYQERDVVMEERRMRSDDDPQGKLAEVLSGIAFLRHPYRNPVIGYPEDIQNLTATAVAKLHSDYYVPRNIVIALVGDVDPSVDLPILERYFGGIPDREPPARPTIVEPKQEGERRVQLTSPATTFVALAYHKPAYPDPDDAPLSVFNEAIAGSRLSPLYKSLVEQKKIATAVDWWEEPGVSYPNLFVYGATVRAPYTALQATAQLDRDLNAILNGNVIGIKDIERAKRAITLQYVGRLKSSSAIANDLATLEALYGDWHALIDWYDQAMNVTLEEANRAAKKYVRVENRTVGLLESRTK